jgi:hypothetical protein
MSTKNAPTYDKRGTKRGMKMDACTSCVLQSSANCCTRSRETMLENRQGGRMIEINATFCLSPQSRAFLAKASGEHLRPPFTWS